MTTGIHRLLAALVPLAVAGQLFAQDAEGRMAPEARYSAYFVNRELPAVYAADPLALAEPAVGVRSQAAAIAPWPTDGWSFSTPEAEGMDRDALIAAFIYAVQHQSKAVVVIRHGYIVGEWYARGWNAGTTQTGYSIAKSVTSALVGMLIDDGVITSVDQKVSDFIPEWRDGTHGAVTVRHLLSMNSGLAWDAISDYIVLPSRPDQNRYAISQPMQSAPNTEWIYNNTAVQVLSQLILNATGKQPARYARDRLGPVLGIRSASWQTDDVGNTLTYQSVIASARDFAKFGYLYLRGGMWDGRQVVSAEWVAASTRMSQTLNPFYGYHWWVNPGGAQWPDAPPDAYASLGLNDRKIYVIPSLDLIAVRLGDPAPTWSDNTFLGQLNVAVLPEIHAAP